MKGALLGARRAAAGAILLLSGLGGCTAGEVFVATGGGGAGHEGGGAQGGGGTTSQGGSGGTTTQGGGGATSQGGGGTTSQGGNGGTGGTTTTTPTGQCFADADCDVALGPAACGQWACSAGVCSASSPGCTDADHDGYGAGISCACAGRDCDDGDPTIADTASKSCYSGPAGTETKGTCHVGTTVCAAGAWSLCGGEVVPGGEACNTQDDDCDGTPDDGLGTFTCGIGACQKTVPACNNGVAAACVPGQAATMTDGPLCNGIDDDCDGAVDEDCKSCLAVVAGSLSAGPDGSFVNPFASVQAAIDWAVAHPAGPQTVCVAAGVICGQTATYKTPNSTTITMADGVSVLGNYESTTWNRCPGTTTTTILQPQAPEGVTFPATVQKLTVLDGFQIDRFNAGGNGTSAGVTVNGAKNVILSGLSITTSPTVAKSYGVNAIGGADLTITKSAIGAGLGSAESIAVRSSGAKVAIKDNCTQYDNSGRCTSFCFSGAKQISSIAGRTPFGSGVTYGVLLENSPGSSIETTAMCRAEAETGALVHITGDATGVLVRANQINSLGGTLQAHGISMEDCGDAAPWIVDNASIAANGTAQATIVNAVRAVGACHPVIDSNLQIVGGGENTSSSPIGVYCGQNAQGVSSKCTILGNARIAGSQGGLPPNAVGVRCDDGACNRIADNLLITGRAGGPDSVGLWLDATGTSVENNLIRGGCSPKSTGVRSRDSYARLENNRIFGFDVLDCGAVVANLQESIGLRVLVKTGLNELDVHSNNIDGGGLPGNAVCVSRGVTVDLTPQSGPAALGVFRNNILRAGSCASSQISFLEAVAGADPRILENNDFDPFGPPKALYQDEGTTPITIIAGVNTLSDITASANLSVDPMFAGYPADIHLQPASLCIGAGTPTGAPTTDFEGDPRDPQKPDIGADEN